MIVNTTQDLYKHVNVNSTYDFSKAAPFIRRAERKYLIPTIGKETYTALQSASIEDPDVLQVKFLLAEASSNLGFHLGFTQLCIDLTNYGATEADLEHAKTLDWATKRDLQRDLVTAGFEALDEALKEMEYYVDKFPEWRDSEAYSVFKEHFNRRTDEFQQEFDIHYSRKTFIALKPTVREVHEHYFLPMLGSDLVDKIKERTVHPLWSRALELCQKAEVSLTIAKSVDSGAFMMTGSSAMYKWEQLPWEKTESYSSHRLAELKKSKQQAGEEYLKKLHDLLLKHPDIFSYENSTEKKSNNIIKLTSGLVL